MIRRLSYLNGIAVLWVILNHASGWGFTALFWWTDRYLPVSVPNFDQWDSPTYYSLRVIEQLIIFAIASFLFVSGFFIAFATQRTQPTIGWNIVGVRIKNLIIPYLIWSILIILGEQVQGAGYSFLQISRKLIFGGVAPPYYYVPLLCQLYLFSPFLVPLARNRWKLLLLVTALIQLFAVSLRYEEILGLELPGLAQLTWISQSWFFPSNIFWFSFGIVTGFHLKQLKPWLDRVKWALLILLFSTFLLGIFEWETLLQWSGQEWIATRETVVDHLYALTVLLSFLAFDKVALPFFKVIENIGMKSFGVYLTHSPVMEYLARATYHLAPQMLAYQILFQPMLISLGLAIPLLLMAMVKRSPVRGLYVYLFG